MDILLSLSEYLDTALNFEPALILSIILRTLIITGILLIVIKWLEQRDWTTDDISTNNNIKPWKYCW